MWIPIFKLDQRVSKIIFSKTLADPHVCKNGQLVHQSCKTRIRVNNNKKDKKKKRRPLHVDTLHTSKSIYIPFKLKGILFVGKVFLPIMNQTVFCSNKY